MTLTRRIALGAITFMSLTEVGMASTPLLPSPEQMAGNWKLYRASEPATACTLHLQAAQTLLGGELDCAQRLLGARVTAWLVTPDMLGLVGDNGVALHNFNRVRQGLYELTSDADKTLRLEKLDGQ